LPILKKLIETGRAKKITLQYNTNLTVFPDDILKLWEEFHFVEVGISIDGPPQVNEYIRYPTRTEKLVAHLHKLDQSDIRGHFWISTTVQIYNLFYLDELQNWLREQNFKRITSEVSWHILRGPKELSIFALPKKTKDLAAEKLQHSPTFKSIAATLFQNDDSESFPEFLATTKKMDDYRQQSLQNLTELWGAL
jgi:sulfatase maturation enzyme AslB (radical SAM superfamily)